MTVRKAMRHLHAITGNIVGAEPRGIQPEEGRLEFNRSGVREDSERAFGKDAGLLGVSGSYERGYGPA